MKLFNHIRGSYIVEVKANASIVGITGVDMPTGEDNALVSSFSMSDVEKSAIIQCFNGVNHVYAFGHDPESSTFSVTYMAFLGKKDMEVEKDENSGGGEGNSNSGWKEGGALKHFIDKYNSVKISKAKNPIVTVSYGTGLAQQGVVLSISASLHDVELNSILITIAGKALNSI